MSTRCMRYGYFESVYKLKRLTLFTKFGFSFRRVVETCSHDCVSNFELCKTAGNLISKIAVQ